MRPVVRLLHQAAQKWHFARFLLQSDRLQLIAICCNRRSVWTAHLTRHIFSCCTTDDTHKRGSSRKFGVRTSHSMCHLHALMLCVWFSSIYPLSSLCCLSSLLSSCPSSWPSTSSSTMWWTNSLYTSANEDLGTLAEYDPLTFLVAFRHEIGKSTADHNPRMRSVTR